MCGITIFNQPDVKLLSLLYPTAQLGWKHHIFEPHFDYYPLVLCHHTQCSTYRIPPIQKDEASDYD